MTDRLRRLDLLFHTRVLGRSDQEAMIRDYCSSLDAAWEGADSIKSHGSWDVGRRNVWNHTDSVEDGRPPSFVAEFWADLCADAPDTYAVASHPAEALVLACLKAVGCTEEELA